MVAGNGENPDAGIPQFPDLPGDKDPIRVPGIGSVKQVAAVEK